MPTLSDLRRTYFLKMLGLSSSTLTEGDLQSLLYSSNITESYSLPMRSGQYYAPNSLSLSANSFAEGRLSLAPIFIPTPMSVASLSFEVTVAGAPGGAVMTPCVYKDDGQGWPGALAGNSSPIDVTTTGVKEGVTSFSLQRGWHWVGAHLTGSTTPPTVRMNNASLVSVGSSRDTTIQNLASGAQQSGLSSLPSTFGAAVGAISGGFIPRVVIQKG